MRCWSLKHWDEAEVDELAQTGCFSRRNCRGYLFNSRMMDEVWLLLSMFNKLFFFLSYLTNVYIGLDQIRHFTLLFPNVQPSILRPLFSSLYLQSSEAQQSSCETTCKFTRSGVCVWFCNKSPALINISPLNIYIKVNAVLSKESHEYIEILRVSQS